VCSCHLGLLSSPGRYLSPPLCRLLQTQDMKDKTPNPETEWRAVFFLSHCLSLQGAAHAAPSGDNQLVRTTRVRRQTPGGDQPPSDSSANESLREQPVVFNHVYNINVPLESLCSVELDASAPPAPGDGEGSSSIQCSGLNSLQSSHLLPWRLLSFT